MSDRSTWPPIEQSRSAVKVKTADEVAPAQPAAVVVAPTIGASEADLNLLDNLYHELALDAAEDPRPNTPEEDADDAWLMERARQRMAMSPAEVRAQRKRR
jgi:hypothetical protein